MKHQNCHHVETSQFICRANQLSGFYMMAILLFNNLSRLGVLRRTHLAILSSEKIGKIQNSGSSGKI